MSELLKLLLSVKRSELAELLRGIDIILDDLKPNFLDFFRRQTLRGRDRILRKKLASDKLLRRFLRSVPVARAITGTLVSPGDFLGAEPSLGGVEAVSVLRYFGPALALPVSLRKRLPAPLPQLAPRLPRFPGPAFASALPRFPFPVLPTSSKKRALPRTAVLPSGRASLLFARAHHISPMREQLGAVPLELPDLRVDLVLVQLADQSRNRFRDLRI